MTDVTGQTPQTDKPAAPESDHAPVQTHVALEARSIDVQTAEVAPSVQGDVSLAGDLPVATPKSPAKARAAASSRAGTTAKPAAASTARKARAPVREEDSVIAPGIDIGFEKLHDLRDWVLVRREEAKEAVQTHPIGSSVIVFGAGMIFGLLLARR